jgi:hypothetical protein
METRSNGTNSPRPSKNVHKFSRKASGSLSYTETMETVSYVQNRQSTHFMAIFYCRYINMYEFHTQKGTRHNDCIISNQALFIIFHQLTYTTNRRYRSCKNVLKEQILEMPRKSVEGFFLIHGTKFSIKCVSCTLSK